MASSAQPAKLGRPLGGFRLQANFALAK